MRKRFCLAIVFSLLPLVSLQSQTVSTSKPALDTSEVAEAKKLAAEVVDLYKQGKFKEALPLAKRCLQIREKVFTLGDDPLRTALNNLGEVYMALGKYDDAKPLYQRLVKSYEELAPRDVRLALALQSLGTINFVTGQHTKAEKVYRQALEITEKAYAPDSQAAAAAAFYLAEYYQAVGDFKKAEPLYQHIFEITERHTRNPDSEDLRRARDSYICVLRKLGREDRVQELQGDPRSAPVGTDPIMGGVLSGKAITLPKPSYPPEARQALVTGTVEVQVTIDETGKVIQACAVEGPSLLRRASEVAAYHSVFSPTKLSGQPVKVNGIITYRFTR